MTHDERQQMRDVLRAAIARAVLPGAMPTPPGGYRRTDSPEADAVARFTRELTSLGGVVHESPSADAAAVARVVATITAELVVKRALMWDEAWLPVPGLTAALEAAGISTYQPSDADLASATSRNDLATATLGITGADAALAETGSVVLASGPGRGRLASLLPPVHIALVERTRMMRSLPDLLLARPDLAAAGSNLVCITGPSRTADIEHTLSRGVHGPKEVHVILVR